MISNWIILLVVVIVAYLWLRHWTRYIYYKGMKDGQAIAEGLQRGEHVDNLAKLYDRYKRIK